MNMDSVEYSEWLMEESLQVREDLSQTRLNQVPGEAKALECQWTSPQMLLYDCCWVYAGEAEEIDVEEESQKMDHCHLVQDKDSEDYWNKILAYLHLGKLPELPTKAEQVKQRAL